jgi:Xaa-Pro aminopeptidase
MMDAHIQHRQQEAMQSGGLDALVGFSRENVAYSAGYVIPSQQLNIRNRQFAVVVCADGRASMLLSANELTEARERALIKDLRTYDEFSDDPMEALCGLFEDLGVVNGRIGLELDALTAERWDRLRALLPKAEIVSGSAALMDARRVKSPRELELLRKSTFLAHRAQAEAHKRMVEGTSEQTIARWIIDSALEGGAEGVLMVQVAAGTRSTFSNPTPTPRQIAFGEVVKIDVFLTCGGYLSDTGHSVWVREANSRTQDTWAKLAETMEIVEDAVRPGVTTRELWNKFLQAFHARGLTMPGRFLGHGLGLSLHEEPFIAAHTDIVLEPGMVLAIEPVHIQDKSLFWLEDNLLVTETGYESLTTALPHGMIITPTGA